MAIEPQNPYQSPGVASQVVARPAAPAFVKVAAKAAGAGLLGFSLYTAMRIVTVIYVEGQPWSQIEWSRGLWFASLIAGTEILSMPVWGLDRSFLRRVVLSAAGVIGVCFGAMAIEISLLSGGPLHDRTANTAFQLWVLWTLAVPLHLLLMAILRWLLQRRFQSRQADFDPSEAPRPE